MMTRPQDRERLTGLANDLGLDAQDCMDALEVAHDRTNNGGIAEVIRIAAECDTPDWIEDRLRDAADDRG